MSFSQHQLLNTAAMLLAWIPVQMHHRRTQNALHTFISQLMLVQGSASALLAQHLMQLQIPMQQGLQASSKRYVDKAKCCSWYSGIVLLYALCCCSAAVLLS
jgi:hypothetical protein